jgi:hypothetical protein
MYKKNILSAFLILSVSLLIWSCDDDFIESGTGFINSIDLPPMYEVEHIKSYSDQIKSVQTNRLQKYLIGDFNDPVYGKTSASILSQVLLSQTNHDFGTNPEIDSVVLNIPFYSNAFSETEFRLDSIFGNGEIILKVFESRKFLRQIDPGPEGDFQTRQAYFSDQLQEFSESIQTEPLAVSEPFNPRDLDKLIVLEERIDSVTVDTINQAPRIRLKLPVDFFEEKIIQQIGTANLASNNSFANLFRGLHIVAEEVSGDGVMISFDIFAGEQNLRNADITLYYRSLRAKPSLEFNPDIEPELGETWNKFRLDFSGIIVNFFDNENVFNLPPQNIAEGEENMFLRGGQGIAGVVELFSGPDNDGDGISDELQALRERNVLINEANLLLYINEDLVSTSENRPSRLFVYDLDNRRVLIDYLFDPSASSNPVVSRVSHLGPLSRDSDGNFLYKIRLTNHINNVINKDSTNVKIGVLITENVNQSQPLEVRESSENQVSKYIESAITTPRGTVIHGSNSPNEDKKLKLRIQFTEIN